jgi:beta-galactosidase
MKQTEIAWKCEFRHISIAILLFCSLFSTVFAVRTIDLAGQWRCELDRQDAGVDQKWFSRQLAETIKLPGTLQEQGFGDPITKDIQWMGRLYDKSWYLRADYKAFTQPDNIRVPFWLQPQRYYRGAAWYQRQITIPKSWKGRRAAVSFERVQWASTVWLNDKLIGDNDSLSTAHVYDMGILEPGDYVLTVRVDNRMQQAVREDAHSITDSTQTNWNGLVGNLKLDSTSPVWMKDVKVFTDIDSKSVNLKIQIGNLTGQDGKGLLSVGNMMQSIEWTKDGAAIEMNVPLGKKAKLWDEFTPTLHPLKLQLHGDNADDRQDLTVGLRQITVKDAKFYLNGRLTFFRGTHEGCEFPLTGYPPTDVKSWRKVLGVCKDYGLNHMRFHSWCPPEAAFIAADELGMYLQPECSNWGQYSSRDTKLIDWVNRETERIIRAYGNHPSFVLFSSGNEPAGPWQKILLKWCKEWKAKDNRFVYASQTGRSFEDYSGDISDIDYLIAIHIGRSRFRGDSGWFGNDFSRGLEGTTYPVISHETGQWCAYPDLSEIKKYTGALKPKNYEIFRDSLAANGMLEQARDFMMASGQFQKACYKEEIEGLLRTPGMGGFQLLDLHDYPGQGTAQVGVLNVFWESKGYVTPKEFRRFCDVTVPLARMKQCVYTTAEEFNVDVEIAHFGKEPLKKAQPVWTIVDHSNKTVATGQFEVKDIPLGNGISLGTVRAKLESFKSPQAYKLVVGLKNTFVENDWDFWVYPANMKTETPLGVVVTRSTEEAKKALGDGGAVLFMPPYDQLPWDCPPMGRLPIFWNRLMGPGWDRFLGIMCDTKHPALAEFPTESYYDWQWQEVIGSACRGINMNALPKDIHPVVQAIDDWNRNYKLGLLFECRVGKGRLMVSAMDLDRDLQERPVARQLRACVLDYMSGKKFNPKVQATTEQLDSLVFDNRIMRKLGAQVRADQEASRNQALDVIDGNPNSYWLTADRGREQAHPHELSISFPKPVAMTGLVCMARQNDREHKGDICDYVIETSDDGQSWKELLKGKLESTFAPQTILFGKTVTTQYLKLRALSGFGNDTTSSLAELAILYAGPKLSDEDDSTQPYKDVKSTTEEIDVESGAGNKPRRP